MNSNGLKTIELLEGLRTNSEFTKYNAKNFEFNLDPDQSYEIYFQYIKKIFNSQILENSRNKFRRSKTHQCFSTTCRVLQNARRF